jgi:hypothetical protein
VRIPRCSKHCSFGNDGFPSDRRRFGAGEQLEIVEGHLAIQAAPSDIAVRAFVWRSLLFIDADLDMPDAKNRRHVSMIDIFVHPVYLFRHGECFI